MLHEYVDVMTESVSFLSAFWKRVGSPRREYLASVNGDQRLVTLSTHAKDYKKAILTLRTVADDLIRKEDHCKKSQTVPGPTASPDQVAVTVHTVKQSSEESGYTVFCIPSGWVGWPNPPIQRFNHLSSPTETKGLSPGEYTWWLKGPAGAIGVGDAPVGGDGQGEQKLFLTIPKKT